MRLTTLLGLTRMWRGAAQTALLAVLLPTSAVAAPPVVTAVDRAAVVPPGAVASYTLRVTAAGGAGEIRLSASGLPAGANYAISPATLSTSGTAVLRIATGAATPAGASRIAVSAARGTETGTAAVDLAVSREADFRIEAPVYPRRQTMVEDALIPLRITGVNGANPEVTLSVEGLPAGYSASFQPGATAAVNTTVLLRLSALARPQAGAVAFQVAGRSGNLSRVAAVKLNTVAPSFQLFRSSRAAGLRPGRSAAQWVVLAPHYGFDETVELSAVGLPPGVTAHFQPATIRKAGFSKVTLTAASNAVLARTQFNVVGRIVASGGKGKQALRASEGGGTGMPLSGGPDFELIVTPATRANLPGQSSRFTVATRPLEGFSSPVALSIAGLPTGATAELAQTTLSGESSTELEIVTPPSLPHGTYLLNVSGVGGGISHTEPLTLTISDDPGITLYTAPRIVISPLNQSLLAKVQLSALNGFNGPVGLAVGGLPDGVSASLGATSLTVSGTHEVNLTFAVAAGTTPGVYPVSVLGVTNQESVVYETTLVVAPRPVSPWSARDIGTVAAAGSAGLEAATAQAVIQACGTSDWSAADTLHYISQPLAGDGEIVARITGLQDAASGMTSRIGLMLRDSMEGSARQAFVFLDKTGARGFLYRTTALSQPVLLPAVSFPYWLKLAREGGQIAAYGSADGVAWTPIGAPVAIALGSQTTIGLAATAGNGSGASTAMITGTYDRIAVSQGPSFRLTATPAPDGEIGKAKYQVQVAAVNGFSGSVALSASGGPAGTAFSFSPAVVSNGESLLTVTPPAGQYGSWSLTITGTSGTLTRTASAPLHVGDTGTKIWTSAGVGTVLQTGSLTVTGPSSYQLSASGKNTPEGLEFAYQTLSGDGQIVARVTGFEDAQAGNSVGGIMLRGALDTASAYAALRVTAPSTSTTSYGWSYRTTAGAVPSNSNYSGITLPYWLKLTRVGSQVTAYTSTDGNAWTQVGSPLAMTLPGAIYIGLYGISHAGYGDLVKVNYDNAGITSITNPGVPDFQLTAAPPPLIRGNEIAYTLAATANAGFSGTIALTAAGIPSGVTGGFEPGSLNGAGQAQLRLQVPAGTPAGVASITATGTSGSTVRTAALSLITYGSPAQVWTSNDVGSPSAAGSTALAGGTWTLTGGTGSVVNSSTADAFQFAYRPLTGDGYLSVRLASRTGGAAGILLRESFDPKSRAVFFGIHNDGYFAASSRQAPGASASRLQVAGAAPVWLRLVRAGGLVEALSSTDGVTWTSYAVYNFPLNAGLYAGLAVSSGSGVFDSLDLNPGPDFLLTAAPGAIEPQTGASAAFPITATGWGGYSLPVSFSAAGLPAGATHSFTPATLPAGTGASSLSVALAPGTPVASYRATVTGTNGSVSRGVPVDFFHAGAPPRLWVQHDVGVTGRTGSATFDGTVFTLKGAGAFLQDLYSNVDSHSYARTSLSGDFVHVARLTAKGAGWAGLLVRDSFETRSRTAGVMLYSNGQVYFTYRGAPNSSAARVSGGSAAAPRWLKLTRVGNAFSAYQSTDGAAWTQIGTTVTIAMPLEVHAGLAVCSEAPQTLATATFDNLSLANQADFTLSASPATQNAVAGMTAPIAVTLTATGGFATPVDLAVTGVPPGASAVFSQRQLTPAAPSATLSVVIGSGTPTGTYPLTITGTAGALSRSAPATLVVGTTDFTLSLNNTARTVAPGGGTTIIATVNALAGFNSDVTFSASGLPPGVSLLFNPPSIRGGGASTAAIQASPQAPPGAATVTITAASPGLSRSQTFTLTVADAADFSLSSTVASRVLMPGASTDISLTVDSFGGFNARVDLAVAGLPTGATAALEPAAVIAPGPATLRIATAPTTPRGTFPLTISGVSGALRRTLRVELVISTAADYTLSLGPASAAIDAGQQAVYTLLVTAAANFTGTLTFDAVNLPDGAAATFQPATLTQPGSVTVTVNTAASAAAVAGHAFHVTAATGGVSKPSNTATLTINTAATFSLGAAPATQVVAQSGLAAFTLTVTPSGGFASPVALSAAGAPAGATLAFDPPTTPATGGPSTLTIQVPPSAAAQDYTVTVSATGGNQTKTTPLTLTVRTAASYEAEAPANTLTGSVTAACATCSNGQRVDGIGKIGANPPATLRFNGVNAPASGLYALNVYYANPDKSPRSAAIAVNGSATTLSFLAPPTGGLTYVAYGAVQVYLDAGANTIEFGNTLSPAPSLDRVTLMNTATCTRSAIDVSHVIDCSGSVGGQPFSDAKNAAKQFIDRMELTQDKIAVVRFTSTGVVWQELTQDGAAAKTKIDALVSGGSTNIGAGIAAADTELSSARHTPTAQKVMVLLSDGNNTTGPDPMIAATAAKANGVRLITIGYGNHNAAVLRDLASSPSDYYAAPTGTQVYAVYDSVSASVCRAPNQPPVASAGPRQAVPVGQAVTLQGAVSDDGLPTNGILSVTWSVVSGPGAVTFGNANTAATTATFAAAGDYVLRLTVSDGLLASSSDVVLTAMAAGADLEAEGSATGLAGGAAVVPCAGCSGGARVDGLGYTGPSRNGAVTFIVQAPVNGSYTLKIYYTNGDAVPRTANVSVNGDTTPRSFTGSPTGGWDTVSSALLTAPLVTGSNTVRIYNDAAPAPSIDRIEVLLAGGGTLLSTIASSPADAFSAPAVTDIVPAAGSAGAALCRPMNTAPRVFAGPDVTAAMGQAVRLRGSASDDGLPGPPGVLAATWSKISGPGNVLFTPANSPIADAVFDTPGTYVVQLAATDGALNATSRVTVRVGGPVSTHRLSLTPAAAGPLLSGTAQAFEAKVVDGSGQPVSGVALEFTVTGANTYSAQGVTTTAGVAPFTYTGTNTGLDTARVSATAISGVAPASARVAWARPQANVASSAVTARFFTADTGDTFNTAPSQQPVFTEVLPGIALNPPSNPFTGGPAIDGSQSPVLALFGDAFETYIGNAPIAGGSFTTLGGWNGTRWSAVFTGHLIVKTPGQYSLVVDQEGVMVLGVGGGATRVSGPMEGAPTSGLTPFAGLPVMGAKNVSLTYQNQQTVRINFPTAGVYPFELDHRRNGPKQTIFMRYQETSILRPLPPAAVLKITPVESAVRTRGELMSVTVRAANETDGPIAGLPVTLTVAGANPQQLVAATDATGVATFQYTGQVAGFVDTLRATAPYGATELRSAAVKVTWNTGVNQAPVVSAGPNVAVTLPDTALLAGSVVDDGLPAGSTLNIQWSQVSGPGTVTFDNARSAVARAAFSMAGTYVLRLTASDGLLGASADVTVAVSAEAAVMGGWIGSPTNQAQVSGTVSITVAAGVTLTSGTLTYYPSNYPSQSVTLNASVTGSGVIGTLDTTTLPNGTYWLRLAATNSASQTQTSVVQIQVTGEYKPGRIQASMTDLTVPLAGLAIRIERQYDSLKRSAAGDFGYGWRLGYNVDFQVDELHHVTMSLNGVRKTFVFTPLANPVFQGFYTPAYTAQAGLYGKLESTADTCNGVLSQTNGIYRCAIGYGQDFRIDQWKYTDPTGRVYRWSRTAGLTSIEDLNGNKLTFGPNGITSTAGNTQVTIQRDALGRITKITDPRGKDYLYSYNVDGDLATVAYPGIVTAAQFTYETGHLLKDYRDPRGTLASTRTYYTDGRLQSETDGAGQITQYAYNVTGRTTTVTHPDQGVETVEQDARGNVVRRTDGLNRVSTYTYDANNNLLTETNAENETTTYSYDAQGFRTSVKNALNQTESVTYNQMGGPTAVTNGVGFTQSVTYDAKWNMRTIADALGQVAEFSWSNQGLPLAMKDARGNTSMYGYDNYGNRTSYTDPEGRTTTSVYNALGWLLSETDPRGNRTTHTYDDAGRRLTMTNADNKTWTYEYDGAGNKTAEVDPLSRRTTYEYDAKNRLTKTTYPDLTYTQTTYDFRDKPLTVRDQGGRITKYEYDKAGQTTKLIYAFGTADQAEVRYTYDGAGRKLTETDERNNTTTYNYDDAGRLSTVTNAQSKTATYAYDAAGRRTTETDPKNHTTTYEYDGRGRNTKVTYPDTKFVTHTYDGLGLRTSTTDQDNRTTTWTYDKASQLIQVTNALNQITTYGYDPAGNKIRQTDANNRSTLYEYDALNRRTKRTLPLGQFETFTYDAAGNQATRRDFNGRLTTYAYDQLNRLLSKTPDPSFGAPAVTFTYSPTGRRASMIDPSGTTTYAYDNRDRLLTKATPQGTLTYTYHQNGLVASVASSNANGVNIAYGYDTLNRLQTVTDNRLALSTTYTYDDASNLGTVTYPNGVVHTFGYDANDRVMTVPVTRGGNTLASYTYTRGNAGHLSSVTELGRAVNYSYDAAYRLISELMAPGGALSYTHDNVANRLTLTSTVAGIPSATYSYDANDRLAGDTYDANGNTVSSGGVTYTYDFEDRLLTASPAGVTMVYDGDGNRVARTAAGVTTRFLVDDLTPTGYAQVAEELASGAVTRRYTHGTQRISQTQLIGGNWATHYYVYDGGSTVRGLTNTAGTVTDTYSYDAFGVLTASAGSTPNVHLYRGEQWDTSVGLYYLRARWYSAGRGRFWTADKLGGCWYGMNGGCGVRESADPSGCGGGSSCCASWQGSRSGTADNLYAYSDADPVGKFDPSGYQGKALTLQSGIRLTPLVIVTGITAACVFQATGSILGIAVLSMFYTIEDVQWAGLCAFEARTSDNDHDKRCREQYQKCIEHCSETALPTRDHGFQFYNCVRDCMKAAGCEGGYGGRW